MQRFLAGQLGVSLQQLKPLDIHFCSKMKLLHFYLSLFAILFQAIFASSFLNENASLKSKKPGGLKSKKVAGKLVEKRRLPIAGKIKRIGKSSKRKDVVVKKSKVKLLIELLLKELVEIVIGYFDDDTYPFIVSTHSWLLKSMTRIAVDSARLYVITKSEGIKGLNHSLGSISEDERQLIEFGDPKWSNYLWSGSSHDGRYIFFSHSYKALTNQGEQTEYGTKWLIQSNDPEDRRSKRVMFDGECLPSRLLSRDAQTLYVYSFEMNPITRVYRVREEAGKDPIAFMKFELNGVVLAVSGSGNRVIVDKTGQFEILDLDKDASKLVCQIDVTGYDLYACALNEDGSEAAFVNSNAELRIVDVGNVAGVKTDQPAIVTIKIPESTSRIYEIVYSDEGKLHVLHTGRKVSLFDPSTKEFILLEAPREGQIIDNLVVSPNAAYIATVQKRDEREGVISYRTIVKRKLESTDCKDLFGYENSSGCATASAGLPEKATLTQARDALSHSLPAPLIRLTTIPVKEGSLWAFDGNLRHRYVLDDDLVIHRETINSDDDRGSVKLPASVFKGDPQYLQTNSDGTVFYLATKGSKKHYIYVIDVARKRVYEHYLRHLGSDIVQISVHLDGKIVEVTLQDEVVLIFSCKAQRLHLLNKLIEGERVVGVSQSIAVFEERESTGLKAVGYFDLTKASASLYPLPYQNAKFVALDKDDIYLINAKSIVRFNVKTKETATIKKHHAVRSSHVHNGIIRIVDHDFVYRVLDINTFRQRYATRLPSFAQQEDNLHTLISCDGRRVMVSQPDVARLFEIVDPKFLHKMQAIEKRTKAKPVKLSKMFNAEKIWTDFSFHEE